MTTSITCPTPIPIPIPHLSDWWSILQIYETNNDFLATTSTKNEDSDGNVKSLLLYDDNRRRCQYGLTFDFL